MQAEFIILCKPKRRRRKNLELHGVKRPGGQCSKNIRDAAKLWNNAPLNVKNAKTLYAAKKETLKYCQTLPF